MHAYVQSGTLSSFVGTLSCKCLIYTPQNKFCMIYSLY